MKQINLKNASMDTFASSSDIPASSISLSKKPKNEIADIAEKLSKKEMTRKKILDAALIVFSQKGYDKANVSDIVREVGVAQGTFYYHFKDKKTALVELLNSFFDAMKKLVANWAATTDTSADMALVFSRNVADLLRKNTCLGQIIRNETNNPDPEIRLLIKEFHNYLYRQAELALLLGMRLGVVREMDARIAGVALVGMIESVVFELIDRVEDVDVEHVIKEISEMQNIGIRPTPDPRS
ncbi:MAG TPA: TetR/AcrR family transcriptional regulator [bacterium]|nr:MAG: Fatty acid metabolism regulator protein [bacterium ADurb.Bin236]HOY63827.1 TetR/AcrR family transcriptional regulator [bacterium]HPI77935.1 TetR/AcrR family transcriptional regulator [bacterium]HPN94692.1 TetR/AcrR family transcriptional regulator [bacterium]